MLLLDLDLVLDFGMGLNLGSDPCSVFSIERVTPASDLDFGLGWLHTRATPIDGLHRLQLRLLHRPLQLHLPKLELLLDAQTRLLWLDKHHRAIHRLLHADLGLWHRWQL